MPWQPCHFWYHQKYKLYKLSLKKYPLLITKTQKMYFYYLECILSQLINFRVRPTLKRLFGCHGNHLSPLLPKICSISLYTWNSWTIHARILKFGTTVLWTTLNNFRVRPTLKILFCWHYGPNSKWRTHPIHQKINFGLETCFIAHFVAYVI